MKKWFQKHFQRHMIRPIIYQSFTRLVYALTLVLLWNALVSRGALPLSWGFAVPVIVYLLLGWLAFLRLNGLNVPKFDRKLFLRKKRSDRFSGGDIADYLDYKPVTYEELEPEEKDACLLASNLITCAIFFIVSICL